MSHSDYDETPYPGFCYPKSSPARLATIGHLFGMTPPPLATARVLEFGSGLGGNLLPLAARWPQARFVGVDYSANQTAAAQRDAAALGLSNLEFRAVSILDIDAKDLGSFDYVIAHGFYSWVGAEVRERMMELTGELLSPQGIAYVSFNTLPGWNAIRSVRDAMLFHAKDADSPQKKAEKARAFLAYLTEHAESTGSPYRQALMQEARIISASADAFLLHDYMEEVNEAFYLTDFVDHAAHHGLQYLGDAALAKMPLGDMPPDDAGAWKRIGGGDIVRLEQYRDFLGNRRFRMALLCRAGIPLKHRLSPKRLAGLRLFSECRPQTPVPVQAMGRVKSLDLVKPSGRPAGSINGRLACACLLEMIAAGRGGIAWEALLTRAGEVLGNVPRPTLEKDFLAALGNLIVLGIVDLTIEEPAWAPVSERPFAFAPAVLAAGRGEMIPNLRHEEIRLSPQQRHLLGLLDGSRDPARLAAECPETAPVLEGTLRAFAEAALLAK
jgi:trans-aconitate methyltransferase